MFCIYTHIKIYTEESYSCSVIRLLVVKGAESTGVWQYDLWLVYSSLDSLSNLSEAEVQEP